MRETSSSKSHELISNWLDNLTYEEQNEVDTFLDEHDPQDVKPGVWYRWVDGEWIERDS